MFDEKKNAVVIAPWSNFMESSIRHQGLFGGILSWGIMGSLTSLPSGYSNSISMYYSASGINEVSLPMWSIIGRLIVLRHYK